MCRTQGGQSLQLSTVLACVMARNTKGAKCQQVASVCVCVCVYVTHMNSSRRSALPRGRTPRTCRAARGSCAGGPPHRRCAAPSAEHTVHKLLYCTHEQLCTKCTLQRTYQELYYSNRSTVLFIKLNMIRELLSAFQYIYGEFVPQCTGQVNYYFLE